MENFETDIAELFEVDSVKPEDVLSDFDSWDSLTILSIIAYADEHYGVSLFAQEINDCATIGGIKDLILSKMESKSAN